MPVNAVLWSATTIGSVMYVVFGVMGAAVFERTGHNVLVLLASSKVKNHPILISVVDPRFPLFRRCTTLPAFALLCSGWSSLVAVYPCFVL